MTSLALDATWWPVSPGKLLGLVFALFVSLGGVAEAAKLRYEAPAPCPSRERFADRRATASPRR
jgi:hypothetical protein